MLEIGSVLDGKYKILNEIGHGGMSVVYLALNERANKTWAVKEVRKDGGADSEVVSQGLVAETEMLKKLNHPNLPSIVDVIDKSDTFIIVMDYIEGRSLQEILNHSGAQDPEVVLEWSKQLCDVLGYLHTRQPSIIYRDMKPANVMLRPDGQVALIDFGTAREYKEHSQGDTTWLGTRGYAAPEQFGGRGQTDARTDIYCLGATMYHLLTGYSPADTNFVIHPLGKLIPELGGSGLEKVVLKCCQPDPANRYQSCAEMMYALDNVHDEDNAAVKVRNSKWKRFVAACCVALVGIVGMGVFKGLEYSTASSRYDALIQRAAEQTDIKEKANYYEEAMRIYEGRKDAYENLLHAAQDPEGYGGESITGDEMNVLSGAYESHLPGFKNKNKKDYLEFQYDRAITYFRLNGSKKRSKDIFDELKKDKDVEKNRRNVSSCMSSLCDAYILSNQQSGGDGNVLDDYIKNDDRYRKTWRALEKIAKDPSTIDEKTGAKMWSALIYKEIAGQINTNSASYMEAGITKEQMKVMLESGNAYISSNGSVSERSVSVMLDQAKEEIEKAQHLLKQDKKTLSEPEETIDDGNMTISDDDQSTTISDEE